MISGGSLKEALCKENIRMPWDSNDELPVASLTTSLKLVYQFKADFVVVPSEFIGFPSTVKSCN